MLEAANARPRFHHQPEAQHQNLQLSTSRRPITPSFAVLATLVHWALERTALLDTAMASTSNILGGLVFVAAGSYQWTRLKDVCLTQCQMPFAFLMRHGGFRRDVPGCLLLGLATEHIASAAAGH